MKNIASYIFEIGMLRRERHNGFKMIGIDNPDSVAEHAMRAAQIGYILTFLENEKYGTNTSPEKVASMLLFHDNGETRIGDLHKVASRYINSKEAEKKAFSEQADNLPKKISKQIIKYFNETEERNTAEGLIAKDADRLETAFMAKEYYDLGNKLGIDWINNVEKDIKTESAKELLKALKEVKFTDWWISKMLYKGEGA